MMKTWTQVITVTDLCEREWCQLMMCSQHHSESNIARNRLWLNEKIGWESSVQSWDRNDSWHQEYNNLHWTACYENDCTTHTSEKDERYYLKSSTKYYKKKEARWATWNTERAKISHQVKEFSEEIKSKSKSLKMRWKEIKERVKAISSW